MSLHEVSTSFFFEELHITRKKGAVIVTVSCGIIGVLCSLSLGSWDFLRIGGMDLFDLFDFVGVDKERAVPEIGVGFAHIARWRDGFAAFFEH